MRYVSDDSDYLVTYDPYCVEQYIDSSDFDSGSEYTSGVRRKLLKTKINMESIERTMFCARSNEKNCQDNSNKLQYLKNGSVKVRNGTVKDVDPTYKKHNYIYEKKMKYCERNYDCNNRNVHVTQSKLANMRDKVMPCLSSIFCRYPTKRAERVKEYYAFVNSTKDNSCQVYSLNCNHKRTRKSNKRGHDFTVQSIYSVDEELKETQIHEPRQLSQDSSESCPFSAAVTPSSQSLHTAKNKFRKIVERELKKYYQKKLNMRRNKDQQCPSKANFLIYNSQQSPTDMKLKQFQDDYADVSSFGCGAMPSSSSVFWEYLVDRISKKYQNHNRGGVQKTSHCTYTQQCPSMRRLNTQEQSTQNSRNCSCKSSTDKQMNATDQQNQPAGNKSIGKNQVHCKCGTSSAQKSPQFPTTMPRTSPGLSPPLHDMMKPCQEPHDELKASLEQKYNGEILCIHNPPCILINGCLNLPPMKGQHAPSAWSTSQQTSYHVETNQSRNNMISEQERHNNTPTREFLHYHIQVQKCEKMTQSVCNHVPPCAVVRCCYKPNLDLKKVSSCAHVPLCPKIPECLLCNSDLTVCDHQPKCPDLPVCKEKSVRGAKENTETQVLPASKLECRHQPPCIMIPRCLGRLLCDGYVLYDAIPSCVHRPPCDMIPACHRKSAKMVSVYCQYPAPCRIF